MTPSTRSGPSAIPPVPPSARRRVETTAPWARTVGYARAVRVGERVLVSGTVAADGQGGIAHHGDAYAQTRRALEIVVEALAEAGAGPEHVVRTRMYVRDIGDWQEIGRAHGEFFAAVRPATSMVQVAALIDPEALVEIEAEAVL